MFIAGFIVLAIGVILMICYPISKNKNKRCTMQTQGTLIKIFETDNSGGSVGHAHVYSYYVDGIEYQLNSTAYNPQADQVGDPCTIWYNPANPKEAQEFHYGSDRIYKIILIIGIAMLLSGFILIGFAFVRQFI